MWVGKSGTEWTRYWKDHLKIVNLRIQYTIQHNYFNFSKFFVLLLVRVSAWGLYNFFYICNLFDKKSKNIYYQILSHYATLLLWYTPLWIGLCFFEALWGVTEWTGPFGTHTKFCFAVFVAVTFFCCFFVIEMIVKKET